MSFQKLVHKYKVSYVIQSKADLGKWQKIRVCSSQSNIKIMIDEVRSKGACIFTNTGLQLEVIMNFWAI